MTRTAALLACVLAGAAHAADIPAPRTSADIVAAAAPGDWREPDPENTLYVELPSGRVVIELAPQFAPRHVANIKRLARARYYDGLAVVRSQDNYVAQWGDPEEDDGKRRSLGEAAPRLPMEFFATTGSALPFTRLPDGDIYAAEAGLVAGFPAAREPRTGQAWLAHCYAMVGAGRGDEADSGNGSELYVVTGHAPRHLDGNVTLVGRVIAGIDRLSTLPRGTGALGFYEDPAQRVPLRSVRVAADVPAAERSALQLLRTDTPLFAEYIESRRTRREPWFLNPVGRLELCNVPIPVRAKAPASP